jgi:KUP system potassium uptake protein
MSLEDFVENILQGDHAPSRVPNAAVFMTANPHGTPRALGHNLRHNRVIHDPCVALTVQIADEPFVARDKKVEVKSIGRGFYRVRAVYGFMESPSVPEILELAGQRGLKISMFGTAFFLGRENIRVTKRKDMARWRQKLFAFLARNSQSATDFYGIPSNQVIELGLQVEL